MLGDSNVTVRLAASAKDVQLWWPAGAGGQPLYNVTVALGSPGVRNGGPTKVVRTIGFRTFALVTGNDTDPAWVRKAAHEEGTERHGMYFRVNGALMYVLQQLHAFLWLGKWAVV